MELHIRSPSAISHSSVRCCRWNGESTIKPVIAPGLWTEHSTQRPNEDSSFRQRRDTEHCFYCLSYSHPHENKWQEMRVKRHIPQHCKMGTNSDQKRLKMQNSDKKWYHVTAGVRDRSHNASCWHSKGKKAWGKEIRIWPKGRYSRAVRADPHAFYQRILG